MKGFKRVKQIKFKVRPGTVNVLNICHDDWCAFWQSDNFADCNCEPDTNQVEVTDENLEQVAKDWDRDERAAQRLREIARRRN